MRRYLLLLALALPAAGILATGPPIERALGQPKVAPKEPKDDPAPGEDDPGAPEKLGRLTLTIDAGWHSGPISKVFFTPDGKQVITLSADHSIRIWDPLTGEMLKVLYPPGVGELDAAALSSDGKRLALATRYPEGDQVRFVIYVLTIPEGQIERVLRGHTDTICALTFSLDGKRLASASGKHWVVPKGGDNTIRLWNLDKEEAGQVLRKVPGNGPRGLCFSPDGSRLAWVCRGKGEIFDLETGKKVIPLKGYIWGVHHDAVDWSPDGKTLATIFEMGVQLWDADGKPIRTLSTLYTTSVVFSRDSRTVLATTGSDWVNANKSSLFEVHTGKKLAEFPPSQEKKIFSGAPLSGALSPDGQLAVSAGTNDTFVWRTENGALQKALRIKKWIPAQNPRAVWSADAKAGAVWSADGKAVAWITPSKTAKAPTFHLGDLQVGAPLATGDTHGAVLKQGAWSLKKNGADLQVLKNGEPMPPGSKGTVRGATLVSKDRVALQTYWSPLGMYDAHTGKMIHPFRGHRLPIFTDGIAASPDGRFLLTFSWDQTLKIWNPDREKPLLTLYKSGNDWIAWTPEGYYAATPGGERLMGWTVDNGIDRMPSYYPAERFRKQLYRPDVISRLLEFGSVEKALEAADKERGIISTRVPLEDALPPQAMLIAPAAGTVIKEAKVTVRAKAVSQGKFPITDLQLMVDGRPVQGGLFKVDPPKLGTVESTWTIDLPPGPHQLGVVARTAVSSGLSPEIELTYEAPKALDTRPALYVLSIGINTYPGDWKLTCARNDAEKLALTFQNKSKALYRDVQARILFDNDATRSGILDGFTWLKKQMKAQDVAVIFFAGHGTREKGNFYLMPCDVDLANLAKTGVSGDELKNRLANLPGRVLMMLDACHSGAIGAKGGLTAELTRDLSDDDCGVIVMCAAMGREEAGEERKLGHGYFALALIEALSGKADVSRRDGAVYLHHLDQYVNERVVELSNDEQHPVSGRPTTVRSFALAKP
jgi:WD40 repeat protein